MSHPEDLYGPRATVQRNFRGAKILLVDDNPDHCALIQAGIQQSIPEVDLLIANTPEEALQLLGTGNQARFIRLILLDLYIPRREDGWQLLRLLKESASAYRSIPVTLFSNSSEWDDIQTSYDLGGTSYIVKPTNPTEWLTYFQALRQYWWHTVTLPLG